MTTANAVAAELTRLAALDAESDPLSAARLHRLLYYCQGWHLAWYARPLFAERIAATDGGPVVLGFDPAAGGAAELSAAERESVAQVWSHYRRYSAVGLREMAKRESPYRAHHLAGAALEIPVSALAGHFGDEFERQTGERRGAMAEYEAAVAAGNFTTLDQLRAEWGS